MRSPTGALLLADGGAPTHQLAVVLGGRDINYDLGPDGRHVEIFGGRYPGQEHFATGPVVGFAARDLPAAVDQLGRAGVDLTGEPGPTWRDWRAWDGLSSWSWRGRRSMPGMTGGSFAIAEQVRVSAETLQTDG